MGNLVVSARTFFCAENIYDVLVIGFALKSLEVCHLTVFTLFRLAPPRNVREMYARGIVELFPYLMDPYSKNGYVSRCRLRAIIIYACANKIV